MKWYLAVPAAIALALPSLAGAQSGPKIAFVDLEYALNNVDAGKKAKAILDAELKRKNQELDSMGANLVRLENELQSQSLVLSDEARREKTTELVAAREKFETERRKAQEEWRKKEASLTRDLLEGLTKVVEEIGREGNYTFILERHDASVLYAQENVDLTREVIERFNKQEGR